MPEVPDLTMLVLPHTHRSSDNGRVRQERHPPMSQSPPLVQHRPFDPFSCTFPYNGKGMVVWNQDHGQEIEQIFQSGHEQLPSEALGYAVGGSMSTVPQDPQGTKSAEMFFEIRIKPEEGSSARLLTGQRVVARIRMHRKPLAVQWWLSIRQLFQRRFHI